VLEAARRELEHERAVSAIAEYAFSRRSFSEMIEFTLGQLGNLRGSLHSAVVADGATSGETWNNDDTRLLRAAVRVLALALEGWFESRAREAAEIEKEAALGSFHDVAQYMPVGFQVFEEKSGGGLVLSLENDAGRRLSRRPGHGPDVRVGSAFHDVWPTMDRNIAARLQAVLGTGIPTKYEMVEMDGEFITRAVDFTVFAMPGRRLGVIFEDITDDKRAEQELIRKQERLSYISARDSLTGLYNRTYFDDALVRLGDPSNFPVSVMMIDVDMLKMVNDILGHDQGDALLRRVGAVLSGVFRANDIVARIGGDEFAVLLPKAGPDATLQVERRVRDAFRAASEDPSVPALSVSVGVATAVDEDEDLACVMRRADNAMYSEKTSRAQKVRAAMLASMNRAAGHLDGCARPRAAGHGEDTLP
jgi:diguanylate cyclase (GGDEF)-like protein